MRRPVLRLAAVAVICLLFAASFAQATHVHNGKTDARHACSVCASHAPAVVNGAVTHAPSQHAVGAAHAQQAARPAATVAFAVSIRPPPSV
jgi:hypothetical protein